MEPLMKILKFTRKIAVINFSTGLFLFLLGAGAPVFSRVSPMDLTEIVISLTVNLEKKGDLFCLMEGKTIYLPLEELQRIGIRKIDAKILKINQKEYIILQSWKGIQYEFIEDKMELKLLLPPDILPEQTITLQPKRRFDAVIPEQNSAFLNYYINYGKSANFTYTYFNHELGLRLRNFTFLSTGFYRDSKKEYIRLSSSLIYDNRKNLTRFIIGDYITPSGPLSSGSIMGGISYFRHYRIDPYFIYRPGISLQTFTTYPSEMEIYVDNILIKRETISPGKINISDFYYYGGRKDVKIILKDPFGRITTFTYPFYFTDLLLKKGLREFNYSVGFLRRDFTVKSNEYADLAFLFMERYGLTDWLNLGGRIFGVATKSFYNLSLETNTRISHYGVLSVASALSTYRGALGKALLGSYSYQIKNYGFRLTGLIASEDYEWTYKEQKNESGNTLKKSASFGISYDIGKFGSLHLDLVHQSLRKEEENKITFGYSKTFGGKLNLFLNFQRYYGKNSSTNIFFGLNLYPKKNYHLSLRHSQIKDSSSEVIQATKLTPFGGGLGWRLSFERLNNGDFNFNPYFHYKSPYGIYDFDGYIREGNGSSRRDFRLSAAGSILYTSGFFGFSRPVYDSFGVVKTGLEGVKIRLNGGVVGKTNRKGYLFLPEAQSYHDNFISIDDRDVPLEYDLYIKDIVVSPGYRSGFCLELPIVKKYRYVGYLKLQKGKTLLPLEFSKISIEKPIVADKIDKNKCLTPLKKQLDREISIFTSKDGEFYIDELTPGVYKAKVIYGETTLKFDLILPNKEEPIIELGEVIVKSP